MSSGVYLFNKGSLSPIEIKLQYKSQHRNNINKLLGHIQNASFSLKLTNGPYKLKGCITLGWIGFPEIKLGYICKFERK
jgi:hypothetical protein